MLGCVDGNPLHEVALQSIKGKARVSTRIGIDIVDMLWDNDVNNLARAAQASIAGWDEQNAHERAMKKAEADARNKSRRRR